MSSDNKLKPLYKSKRYMTTCALGLLSSGLVTGYAIRLTLFAPPSDSPLIDKIEPQVELLHQVIRYIAIGASWTNLIFLFGFDLQLLFDKKGTSIGRRESNLRENLFLRVFWVLLVFFMLFSDRYTDYFIDTRSDNLGMYVFGIVTSVFLLAFAISIPMVMTKARVQHVTRVEMAAQTDEKRVKDMDIKTEKKAGMEIGVQTDIPDSPTTSEDDAQVQEILRRLEALKN